MSVSKPSQLLTDRNPGLWTSLLEAYFVKLLDPDLTAGAHDEKVRNLVMSLFGSHLVFDSSGLKVMK